MSFNDMIWISPTQIHEWRMCPRRWAFNRIERIREPESEKMREGTEMHLRLEHWLKSAKPVGEDPIGRIAFQAIKHLPQPDARIEVEQMFRIPLDVGAPKMVLLNGKIDAIMDPRIFNLPRAKLYDHKSCSGLQYAMTEQELRTDPQGLMYTFVARERWGIDLVDCQWTYCAATGKVPNRKPDGSRPVNVTMDWNDPTFQAAWRELVEDMRQMVIAKLEHTKAATVHYNTSGCDLYPPTGCFHQSRCQREEPSMFAKAFREEKSKHRALPILTDAPAIPAVASNPVRIPMSSDNAFLAMLESAVGGTVPPPASVPAATPAPAPVQQAAPVAAVDNGAAAFMAMQSGAPAPAAQQPAVQTAPAPAAPVAQSADAGAEAFLASMNGTAPAPAQAAPRPTPVIPQGTPTTITPGEASKPGAGVLGMATGVNPPPAPNAGTPIQPLAGAAPQATLPLSQPQAQPAATGTHHAVQANAVVNPAGVAAAVAQAQGEPLPTPPAEKPKRTRTKKSSAEPRFTLLVNCVVAKGDTEAVLLADYVKPFLPAIAQHLQQPHWNTAEFGRGKSFLAMAVEHQMAKEPFDGTLYVDTRTPEGEACLASLERLADHVVRGVAL